MATKHKDFDFSRPQVGKTSREGMATLLKVSNSSPKPNNALVSLMTGKPARPSTKKK